MEKPNIKQMLSNYCPVNIVNEVYPCVSAIPNLEFTYSDSKKLVQSTLHSLRKKPTVLLPSFFSLYGESLFGVDIVLKGAMNVFLVSYYHVEEYQLKQKNILFVVKEG